MELTQHAKKEYLEDNMNSSKDNSKENKEKVVMTVCTPHCGAHCLLKVHVRDGVITRIETDEGEEPQIRGCLRGRANRQRVYAPDRLKFPLKRVDFDIGGERHPENRGKSGYERVSWDEALNIIAGEIKRVRDTYGPGSILYRGGGGDTATLHTRRPMARLLGMAGGFSETWGMISYQGGYYAELATYGTLAMRNSMDDILNSRLIILWGWDPAISISDCNSSWYLVQAKEAGIKVISIDPRYTETTAAVADQWIPIRPGTDAAMLIAMAYVMIKADYQDQNFLDTYTIGFDKFKDYVMGTEDGVLKSPAWAEAITGVSSEIIENLAKEYAATKPAALLAGIAPGRTAYGEQYHRAAMTLAAMTGNVGIHGGSVAGRCHTGFGGFPFMKWGQNMATDNPVEEGAPLREYAIPYVGLASRGRINTSRIADAILKGKEGGYPYDYKLLYIMNANYLNQAPNINKIAQAFRKLEFVAVQEQFMTPTAKFADIVLPVCTFLERNDITIGEGVPFYGCMNKAIEPLYESKSQLDIACALADKLGISDFSEKTEEEWLIELVKGSDVPDYDEFKRKGVYRPKQAWQYVAFKKQIEDPANYPFPTPSGKIEIYSQRLADFNNPKIPPIPKYIEGWESLNDPLVKKYPLQLLTTQCKRRAHSQLETLPWLREVQEQVVQMNTVDAQARGIIEGDKVMVFNDRGKVIIRAHITERILPGVVDIGEGAWYDPDDEGVDRGGSANVLTSDEISPGGAVPYHTGLVQIQKLKE